MKNKILFLLAALCAFFFTGCAQFPGLTCDHWQHQGNYGAVTTQYEATGVAKLADGSIKIATYSGNVKVLGGYGVSDTVQGLVLTPAQAATGVADQKATSLSATAAPATK